MYLIKSSFAISLIWNSIKSFMEEATVKKINFYKDVKLLFNNFLYLIFFIKFQ